MPPRVSYLQNCGRRSHAEGAHSASSDQMSVYVTDTHSLIYYVTGHNAKLSRRALRAFQQAERGEAHIYIPAVVLWEISRLEKEGEIRLNEPYEDWADALLAHPG